MTTLLNDLIRMQTDAYELTAKLSDIVSSKSDTITMKISDSVGQIKYVTIPSFKALSEQIRKLETDVSALSGVNRNNTTLRLADGKIRKVITSSLQKEASDIKSMAVPSSFFKKENWFFESFLNPLLYVKFDLTGQIKSTTENVEINRFILNLDSTAKVRIFEERLKGNASIAFQDFYELVRDNAIQFFSDREVVPLPPRSLRFFGKFSVTEVFNESQDVVSDGSTFTTRTIRIKLDTLKYNDRNSRFLETQSLKIGDSLVVESNEKNTRFKIEAIDSATRTLSVSRIEGYDSIKVGADILSYFDADDAAVSVDVNIGFNENCVIFIKPIDPDSKLASVNWSPGVAFNSNDLKILNEDNQEVSLATFYQNSVVDFGAYLYSVAKEKVPPAIFGIVPDAPSIQTTDLKVVQINEHLTNSASIETLKKLQADKIRIQSTIRVLDSSISSLRTKIQTSNYRSKKLEETDKSELTKLIDERDSNSSLFTSTVDNINKITIENNTEDLLPKYRIRGFFPMPEAKASDRTNPQEVVQFIIQYRYLKKDGSANNPAQIEFADNEGNIRRGSFSTWVEEKTPVRRRTIDPETGAISWSIEDVENSDEVNINQIDIPISQNESVEIRIKSLSEAGWPVSPKESIWSDIAKIDFPADLESIQTISSISEDAKRDKIRLDVNAELTQAGVFTHIEGSFSQGNKYFAHTAADIASGFFTNEKGVLSLFEKLQALTDELSYVKGLIDKAKGKMVVRVVGENGEEIQVEPNMTTKVFAGNYRDEVSSLSSKKGVIVTKNYFIKIQNDATSNLELYARQFGDRYSISTASYSGGADFNSNDIDYNLLRRYDYVPISISNPTQAELDGYGFIKSYPEQSAQVKGQFIANRYRSIDGKRNLYSEVDGATYGVYNTRSITDGALATLCTTTEELEYAVGATVLDAMTASPNIGSTAAGDFIWKGGTNGSWVIPYADSSVQSNFNSSILIHVDHPLVSSWATSFTSDADVNLNAQEEVRNSIFANTPFGSTGSDRQSARFYEGVGGTADKGAKIGFLDTDQYLIGPKSTGAYLFMNPGTTDLITVQGSDNLSFVRLEFGKREILQIPIVFQYRMTDYFGVGDQGIGNVAGNPSFNISKNLTFTKTIGIDIYSNPIDREKFSFDLEVSARYYSKSLVSKDIPLRTFENALDDFTRTQINLTPNTSRNV